MAHHSGPDEKASKALQELFQKQDTTDKIRESMESLQLGATGRFPQGPLGDDDEGELRIGITATDGKVILAFGKSIDWTGFDPGQAREIARLLLSKAQECDGIAAHVRIVRPE